MRIFSYVVNHDIGFAPNPFHGYCTLAACKPQIRRAAAIGDWVIGTGAAKNRLSGTLVYAMRVTETLTFDEYWLDERFRRKRPNLAGSRRVQFGDNIYHRLDGEWVQEDSRHSRADGTIEPLHLRTDTGVTERVLISDDFVYFGALSHPIPAGLRSYEADLVAGRGHRCHFSEDQVIATDAWLRQLPRGAVGTPFDWHRSRYLAQSRNRAATSDGAVSWPD